jgi:hypothetical protein
MMPKKRRRKKSPDINTDKKISAYTPDCRQHLVDHHFRLDDKAGKLKKLEDINKRLARARRSLSPSKLTNATFERLRRFNDDAISERRVTSTVIQWMLGETDIRSEEDILFNNLKPLTDESLADPKPDLYDGAVPESLNLDVRKELGKYIVPSKHSHAPILPNFFMEIKGSDGSPAVVKRQIAIDTHLGARGIKALRDYGNGSDTNDGNARSFGTTYVDGHMQLYAAHTPEGQEGPADNSLTQLRAFAMTDWKNKTIIEGTQAFRNLRELAMEEREEAIKLANARREREYRTGSESQISNNQGDDDPPLEARERTRQRRQPGIQASQKQREQAMGVRRSSRVSKRSNTATTSAAGGPSNTRQNPRASTRE